MYSNLGTYLTMTLFQLTFRAREAGLLSKAIKLSPRWLRSEAYKSENETMDVDVQFANAVTITPTLTNDNFELYQNAPNPFATQTVVSFRLPETTVARLTIFDTSGRIVYTREGEFYEGYNEVVITRGEVGGEGMLYYRLETKGRHATRKMLLLD
ncbi:MAG TPA: T9SS type A sorting domain-containing protein [Saprospiraceae bacterium]|nr:T9SS type A sorting domain-containing protein [Saprospiraceae bacterium]